MKRASETDTVTLDELRQMAKARFGDMVKAVVDLRRGVMLLDADLHADQEAERCWPKGPRSGISGASICIRTCRNRSGSSSTR